MTTFRTISVVAAIALVALGCSSSSDDGSAGVGGSAQGGSAQGGSAQGGAAQGGSAQGGSAQGGSAQGGSAQGGSAQGGSSSGYANCEKLCDAQATADCAKEPPRDQCIGQCNSWLDLDPWCKAEAKATIDCGAGIPGDQWECDEDDESKPKDESTCSTESVAMQSCWFDGPSGGLPDMSADCKAYCDNIKNLDCAPSGDCEANCKQLIETGFGTEGACKGAFAGIIHCSASKMTSSDFECDGDDIQSKTDVCDNNLMMAAFCQMNYCDDHKEDPDCKQN